MISAMNPTKEEAHWGFMASYIWLENRGKTAPNMLRHTVFAEYQLVNTPGKE